MSKVRDAVIIICCLVLLAGVLWYGYNKHHGEKNENIQTEQIEEVPLTVDQKVNYWKMEKQDYELYNLALELPEEIVREIISRIGTQCDYIEIATEYLRNKGYYISKQIEMQMPNINGPDAKNATIRIKTDVKEEEKPTGVKPSIAIEDSIQ